MLNGHLHNYSRFAPQDAGGHVDAARGVRQFIVGTGGRSLFSLDGTHNVEKTTKAYGSSSSGCTRRATTGSS